MSVVDVLGVKFEMVEEAEKLKAEGNTFFKADQPLKAAALFTRAIKLDPENAVLYSNRSAAFRVWGIETEGEGEVRKEEM